MDTLNLPKTEKRSAPVAISVIVPVYNVESYLDKCLESIVNQAFQNLEIILIDDGSTDSSGDICDKWAAADNRIRVIHKTNGGLSDARNAGIEQARGEWISFVDSDDWIASDMLETLYKLATEYGTDISCCNFARVTTAGDGTEHKTTLINKTGIVSPDKYWRQLFSAKDWAYYNVVWNKLYKKKLFEKIRFPYGKINEDIYVMYNLISACKQISLTNNIGYYYRIRPDSIMGQKGSIRNLDGCDAYLCRAGKFADKKEWEYASACLIRAKSSMLLGHFGENGKRSPEYKALKRKTWGIYRRLILHMPIKQNIGILFFLAGEPIYNKLRPLIRK